MSAGGTAKSNGSRGPNVSFVIPARRWDDHLDETLRELQNQEVPGRKAEIVIALADTAHVPPSSRNTKIVHNPRGTTACGLNIALRACTGDVVIRVDSRALVPPGYAASVCKALEDSRVGCVGGMPVVLDAGIVGSAYAAAFNSPLLGPSRHRYSARRGASDTVYLGAWRKETIESLGGFDETLIRNQDNELARRIREAGLVVLYDPGLRVGYRADRGLRQLALHHFEFGLWRARQTIARQSGFEVRHIVTPLALATAGAAAGLLGRPMSWKQRLIGLASCYLAMSEGSEASARRARRGRLAVEPPSLDRAGTLLAPGLAAVLDIAWAAGIIVGLAQKGWRPWSIPQPRGRGHDRSLASG